MNNPSELTGKPITFKFAIIPDGTYQVPGGEDAPATIIAPDDDDIQPTVTVNAN